jgi:hypothetical protein
MTKIFVYQDWPSRDEVEWTDRFSAALRRAGYDVFQEWTLPKPPPQEAVDQALRESDAIVFLLDRASLNSQTFYFNAGVATFGEKTALAVVSRGLDPEQLPVPQLRERPIIRRTAERTAEAVISRLRELDELRVA